MIRNGRRPVVSRQMFRDMRPEDIPPYDPTLVFEEQTEATQQFWWEEYEKLKNGITINGVYFHPWLYWHLNYWHIMVDEGKKRRLALPTLRDNEWFIQENLMKAEEENKGIIMFGTRRFGKALWDDELLLYEDGWHRMGDVREDDMIYCADGKKHKVTAVYPQGIIELFDVTFEDGRTIRCCADHQWTIYNKGMLETRPLKYIMKQDLNNIYIPIGNAVDMPYEKPRLSPEYIAEEVGAEVAGLDARTHVGKKAGMGLILNSAGVKEAFVNSFLIMARGTRGEENVIPVRDDYHMRFILDMCRSAGYYAKYEDGILTVSERDRVGIKDIVPAGRHPATCITVDEPYGLFLTTNYVVTHNTEFIASYTGFNATMQKLSMNDVTGFSTSDLGHIGQYLELGLNTIHPFLKIPRTSTQWDKGVTLGIKGKDNERQIHSEIHIYNMSQGRSKSAVKAAGSTQSTYVFDEVGKGPFIDAYQQAMPGFGTEEGWRCVPILTGTGGNVELSSDAQRAMNNPEALRLITMDYDLLNKRTTKPTWKVKKSGVFVPAQFSHSEYTVRKKMRMTDFLGRKGSYLKNVWISASDFDASTDNFMAQREILQKDQDKRMLHQFTMAYPLKLDDCFLKDNQNQFPVEAALSHKNDLLESGDVGITVEVYSKDQMQLGTKATVKQVAPYPFYGGTLDAPVKIFEMPQSNDIHDYIYVGGLDPYKHAATSSYKNASLGAFYIFKRLVGINDPYANCIVASYVSRPGVQDDFCRTVEILQEGYGAVCLQENADIMYETYLRGRQKEAALLATGDDVAFKFGTSKNAQVNRYGLNPSPKNQSLLIGRVIQYCNEEIVVGWDDDGNEIRKKGVTRIKDIELLDEIIDYDPATNHDRIIAFGHALLLAQYYDQMNYMPTSSTKQAEKELQKRQREHQLRHYKGFTLSRSGFK